jgi:uncharacterized membrane protein (UPF0127 family)
MSRRISFLFAALALLFAPVAAFGQSEPQSLPTSGLEIAGKSGVHALVVEVAVTPDQQATGLMFRKSLPEGRGMLFDFKEDREISMWMKNTFVPLDMIFIRRDGTVHSIAENTTPESLKPIYSRGPARAVLEVVAGTVRRLGIAPGDRVLHPMFGTRR